VPAPIRPGALPVGVQIVAPAGRDELCLGVAAAYDRNLTARAQQGGAPW
jgi:Asp-tRNA(Asn)/Glu-tRNA(Gln) amidotransferase A subunit family amidase